MAHFRAIIQGMRGEASCLGSKKSGLQGEIAGWTTGVRVRARAEESGDEIGIVVDGGNAPGSKAGEYIGTVKSGGVFEPSDLLKRRIIQEHLDLLLIPGRD